MIFLHYKKFYFILAFILLVILGFGFLYHKNTAEQSDKLSYMLYDALTEKDQKEKELILQKVIDTDVEPYSTVAKLKLASILYEQDKKKDQAIGIYREISSKTRFLSDFAKLNESAISGKFEDDDNLYYFSYRFLRALNQVSSVDSSSQQDLRDIKSAVDANFYVKSLSSSVISSYDLN